MAEGSALEMVDQTVHFVHPKTQQSCGFVSVQKSEYFAVLPCCSVLSIFRISGLTYGELSEWSKVQHSKSCGELSVSSTKNLVAMRVLPGSKIE